MSVSIPPRPASVCQEGQEQRHSRSVRHTRGPHLDFPVRFSNNRDLGSLRQRERKVSLERKVKECPDNARTGRGHATGTCRPARRSPPEKPSAARAVRREQEGEERSTAL